MGLLFQTGYLTLKNNYLQGQHVRMAMVFSKALRKIVKACLVQASHTV